MKIELWYTKTGTTCLDAGWYLDVYSVDEKGQVLLCLEYMHWRNKPKGVYLYLVVKRLISQHDAYFAHKDKIFYGYY